MLYEIEVGLTCFEDEEAVIVIPCVGILKLLEISGIFLIAFGPTVPVD